jgi:hypothetical protein
MLKLKIINPQRAKKRPTLDLQCNLYLGAFQETSFLDQERERFSATFTWFHLEIHIDS